MSSVFDCCGVRGCSFELRNIGTPPNSSTTVKSAMSNCSRVTIVNRRLHQIRPPGAIVTCLHAIEML